MSKNEDLTKVVPINENRGRVISLRVSDDLFSDLKTLGSGIVGKGAKQVFDHYREQIKKSAKKCSKI